MDKKPLILLVDDEKDFLEIFSLKLQSAGFEVKTAQSAEEALRQLKEIKPDLILMDFMMPEMDGLLAIGRIRSEFPGMNFKIVFLTNYGEPIKEGTEVDKKFAAELGAADYIRKSEDLDEVVSRIKQILAASAS
ncbi:response regulator [Candidatus Wolfebacteria bacterium]|nr:response regulator [Candidatus Wolfebacteria bacterium]